MQISDKLEFKSQHRAGFYSKPENVAFSVVFMKQMQPALV